MDQSNQRINIYNREGIFQYSFKFTGTGGFQLEYDIIDDKLIIHSNRNGLLFKIDVNGQITDIVQASDSQYNFQYIIDLDLQTSISRNGYEYIRGNVLPSSIISYRLHFTTITDRKSTRLNSSH
jgi:hypothetical protein